MSTNHKIVLSITLFLSVFLIPFFKVFNLLGARVTTTEIIFSFAFLLWIFDIWRTKNKIESTPLGIPISIFLGSCLLSLLPAYNKFIALREILQFIWLFSIYLLIFHFAKERKNRDGLLFLAIMGGVIISLVGVYQYYFNKEPVEFRRISTTFGNPNTFGNYLIGLIPLCGGVYLSASRAAWQSLILICLLVMSIALLTTFSRGSGIGLICGGVIMFIFTHKQFSVKFFALLTLGVLLAAGFVLIPLGLNNIEVIHRPFSDNQRILLAKSGLNMVRNHPFIGIGLGNYPVLLEQYGPKELREREMEIVHNMFLQVWVETGLVGLATFCWLLYIYYKSLFKLIHATRNKREYGIQIGLLGGFTAIMSSGMFGWPFSHGSQEILVVIMALSMTGGNKDKIYRHGRHDEIEIFPESNGV